MHYPIIHNKFHLRDAKDSSMDPVLTAIWR